MEHIERHIEYVTAAKRLVSYYKTDNVNMDYLYIVGCYYILPKVITMM